MVFAGFFRRIKYLRNIRERPKWWVGVADRTGVENSVDCPCPVTADNICAPAKQRVSRKQNFHLNSRDRRT